MGPHTVVGAETAVGPSSPCDRQPTRLVASAPDEEEISSLSSSILVRGVLASAAMAGSGRQRRSRQVASTAVFTGTAAAVRMATALPDSGRFLYSTQSESAARYPHQGRGWPRASEKVDQVGHLFARRSGAGHYLIRDPAKDRTHSAEFLDVVDADRECSLDLRNDAVRSSGPMPRMMGPWHASSQRPWFGPCPKCQCRDENRATSPFRSPA